MAQKMINMVGVDSVHAWFCPVKQATGNVGTDGWARDNVFLGKQCSMVFFSVRRLVITSLKDYQCFGWTFQSRRHMYL
jgi:hypothetical protein